MSTTKLSVAPHAQASFPRFLPFFPSGRSINSSKRQVWFSGLRFGQVVLVGILVTLILEKKKRARISVKGWYPDHGGGWFMVEVGKGVCGFL